MDGFDLKLPISVRDERGAALMIVLIVLMGLTVLGAAGLTLTGNDIRHSENVEAGTAAFYAADAGLQRYLGESNDGSAVVAYSIASMPVTVTPTAMAVLSGGQSLYRIRSVATRTAPGGGVTQREVSTLGLYKSFSPVNVTAALASGTGLQKSGNAGTIDGADRSSLTDAKCPQLKGPDVAGVTVPPGGYSQSGGGSSVPTGSPPIDDAKAALDFLKETGIDWETLHGGGGSPDYTVPPDAWPDFSSLPADAWPVVYVDGDLNVSPTHSGRGTIIIKDNLTMAGSFQWDGLILAGGAMTSNGFQTISGGTITGLNLLLGESVPKSDIGNGNKNFLYNSCYVKLASAGIMDSGGMVMIPGSWDEAM